MRLADQQYDGSVIIDTELDNEGFEKGSEKLKQSVGGLAQAINGMSLTLAKAFSKKWRMPEPELPEKEDMDLPQPDPVKPEVDTRDFDEGTERIHKDMQSIINDIGDELPEPKPVEPELDSQEFEKQAGAMQSNISRIVREIDRMVSTSTQGFRSTSAVLVFNSKLDLTSEKIEEAREQLIQFAHQQIPTDQYAETTASIEKAEKALLKLYERRDQLSDLGASEESKQWQRLELQIKAAEEEVERFEMAADRMRETGKAFVDPAATEQYAAMREQIEIAEKEISTNADLIRQEQIEQARLNVLIAQEKVAHAGNIVSRKIALRELTNAQNKLAMVAEKSVTPKPDASAGSAWRRFSNTMKKAESSAGKAVSAIKGLGGMAVKSAISGVKTLNAKLKGLFTSMKSGGGHSVDTLFKKLTGLKNMLMSRIKRTFISFLFEQIRDSFNELAKFDRRFDESVSNLRNRTSELGANIMVAFGGLIRQIEPYITKAIDTLSAGMTKINAVLASLRGEDSMQVAVRQTQSYADSLKDTEKSAEKAKDAQEKLNATLTSYDEIHKLDSAAEAETAAEQSTSDADKIVYKNVPVDSIFKKMTDFGREIASKVITGIKSGDWNAAGRAISDGLNFAISKLDEKLIAARPKAEKAAQNIADMLNGIVWRFDGGSLGKTIADGLNLALGTAEAFLQRFNFYAFGATIGDGITGAVRNFEWETAGRVFGRTINGIIDTAKGIIEHTDWRETGRGLGRGVNSAIETIDWADAAHTFSAGLKGLFNSITSFIEEVDWEKAGDKLVEFFVNLDYAGIAEGIAEGIGSAIGGLGAFLRGIFKRLVNVGEKWGEGLFERYGGDAGDGILAGIAAVFKDVKKWCKDHILNPLVKGFKKAFGIASPSKEMKPYGEFVGEGILEGIKNIFSNIGNWITNNIVDPFKRAITSAFNIVGDKANGLVDKGKAIANGIKSGLSNGWTTIHNFLTGKTSEIKSDCDAIATSATSSFSKDKFEDSGRNIIHGISSGITDQSAWDNSIGGKIMERISWIKNAFTKSSFEGSGRNIVDGIGEGLTDQGNWDSRIGGKIMERVGWIQDAFDASNFLQAGRNIVAGLEGGLEEAFQRAQEGTLEGGVATLVAASRKYYSVAANVAKAANDEISQPRELNVVTTSALQEIGEVSDAIDQIDDKSIEINVDKATGALDTVASKLKAIAQIFENIRDAFPDFSTLKIPEVATGAFAPARTRVMESDGKTGQEIKQMLQQFIGRITMLEEAIANQNICIEVPVILDKAEIGKANATYVRQNGEISNGNGGLGWTS